jgi:amino acid adenylation domain-containing protein
LNPDITFKELLVQVKQTVLEAVENQAFPVELLPELLNIPASEDDFPLVDTALLLENIHEKQYIEHIPLNMVFRFLRTDESIEGVVEYNSSLYEGSTVERIISHFTRLMEKTLSDLALAVFDIEILPEEEKSQLLVDFNDTDAEYPADKTIHQLFEEQTARTGDNIAIMSMEHGARITEGRIGIGTTSLTYRELNKKSNQLAHLLMGKGVKPDTIVGIMMERSMEMIVGILAILKAGGAYLPIDSDYPQERKRYMLADSNAKILVTTLDDNVPRGTGGLAHLFLPLEEHSALSLTLTGTPPHHASQADSSSLAYVIYTSGTTGKPKGALIEHRNVVRLMFNDKFMFDFGKDDVWTMFHSHCFDFSVWEMYGALLYGGRLIIITKMAARNTGRFPEMLVKEGVTILNQTPTVFYNLIDEELKYPEKRLNLKYVIFGGEALKPGKLKEWKEKYPATKYINMYGITETTVHVTYKEIKKKEIRLNMSTIGKPIPTLTTYIMDRNIKLLPLGAPGELYVGGKGVGRGYLNRPELTAGKFIGNPYKPGEVLYKSGDMVRFYQEGEMEYLGRSDDQVKIRGFRIELKEIESQLLRHRDVKDAIVISKEDETGDPFLCAYIISTGGLEKKPDTAGLTKFLSHTLPDYMIPLYFVSIDHIPLTSNGKVDRKALPEPKVGAGDQYTPPGDWVEEKLVELFSNLLGMEKEFVGIDTHFFNSGGHSLKAAKLISKIHKVFNVIVHIADIFENSTIRNLAKYIKESNEEIYNAVAPAEKKDHYPLSPIQKRLFIVNQMEGIGTAYNLTDVFIVEGQLDRQRLEQAFQLLIKRHESFRTTFEIKEGKPVQVIHENVDFQIKYSDIKAQYPNNKSEYNEVIRSFVKPFDLSHAPLLRVELVTLSGEKHLLLIDTHHIVSDGTSEIILYQDLFTLYEGRDLPELPIQYKDFCQWQRSAKRRAEIEKQEQYWLNRFEKELPDSDIFTDFPRPPVQSFKGEQITFTLEKELIEKIYRLIKETGTTLYMMLLAVYTILLSRYTGRNDIVVGSPVAGREHGDFENIIGVFINALSMRNFPGEELTFREFLEEVKKNTIQAFENQGYPFDNLLEKLDIKVDTGRNPIFDTELVVQNMDTPQLEIKGIKFVPYDYDPGVTQVDIALYVIESEKEIHFNLFYCTALFKRATMERFITYFKEVVSAVVKNRDIKLKNIEISDKLEKTKSNVYDDMVEALEF